MNRTVLALVLLSSAAPCRAGDPAPAPPAAVAKTAAPESPKRAKSSLDSPSEVALDLARQLSFLEQGQAFYKAYAQGSHTAEENKAFLKFLADYEHALETAKQELEVLRQWMDKKSGLTL